MTVTSVGLLVVAAISAIQARQGLTRRTRVQMAAALQRKGRTWPDEEALRVMGICGAVAAVILTVAGVVTLLG